MTARIALNFEDGVTRFVDCRAGETVADAAYREGINIPLDCRDGACGTCKCRVQSGAFDAGSYIEEALDADEAAAGFALACQMRPRSDLAIDIRATSAACRTAPQTIEATLSSVELLSPTAIGFSVETAAPLGFLPGQYVNVGIPGTAETRAYSFASAPGRTRATFLVRNIEEGRMSSFLRGATPGVVLPLTGPSGSFYLRDVARPLLFLAGGTGLAPFLAMLEQLAGEGCAQPVRLVYGVTRDEDLVGCDRLDALAARLPGFHYRTVVAAGESAHPRRGYVTGHVEPDWLNGGDVDVYLCGPPPMVDAVRGWLGGAGVAPAAFHYEKFAPATAPRAAA